MSNGNSTKQDILYDHAFSKKGVPDLLGRKRFHFSKVLTLLNPRSGDRILDIGCNRGELVQMLRHAYPKADILGCDINEEAITNSSVMGLDVMRADDLKYPNNSFDKIVSLHTLEHVADISKALEEVNRVLKSDGICILIYPFEIFRGSNNIFSTWRSHGNPMLARKLHVHRLTPSKIEKLTSMKIIKKGLFYAPFPTYFTVLKK